MPGSLLISLLLRSLLSLLWDATVGRARIHFLFGQLAGLIALVALGLLSRMRFKISEDVYIREVGFVPFEVREQLFHLCNFPYVNLS